MISHSVAHAALGQVVVQQQRALARRGRALERRSADADDRLAAGERRAARRQPLRAGDRVELVARLGEPGRRVEVVVGAERDDEDVGVVDARVGRDPARLGIDRRDRLLQEADAGLGEVAVRKANRVQRRPPEHHVELRVAEDERVALVDQRDGDLVADRLRQHRRELEPAEAGSQDDDSLHRTILGEGSPCQSHMARCETSAVSTTELVEIRRLGAAELRAHLDGLAAVLVDCVAGGASVGYMAPFSHEDARDAFGAWTVEVEDGRRLLLAAFADDELVGTVQVVFAVPPNQPHRADIAKLLVHRAARRRGIAERLMEQAEAEARKEGRTLLVLDAVSWDGAARLYQRMGWTTVGVIPNYALYPDGRPCDTTYFWKAI